jgi:transposase
MNAYSLDIREKIVATYERGNTSIRKVARRFQVSKGVVQNLINLNRRTGQLRPKKATGGRKSQLAGREEELALMVEEYPDIPWLNTASILGK